MKEIPTIVKWSVLRKIILLGVVSAVLAGCAAAKSNVQMIDSRTLHVTTQATGIGDRSDVLKSLYTEIAKEAAQRGYSYFVITGSKSYDDVRFVHSPGNVQYSYSYNRFSSAMKLLARSRKASAVKSADQ